MGDSIRSGSQQALFVKRQTPIGVPGLAENGEFDSNPNRGDHANHP